MRLAVIVSTILLGGVVSGVGVAQTKVAAKELSPLEQTLMAPRKASSWRRRRGTRLISSGL